MKKYILKQKISNHPIIKDVERFVIIKKITIDPEFEQITLPACIQYIKDEKDVTPAFNSEISDWYVKNDTYSTIRDMNGAPVPNPDYNAELPETETNSKNIRKPSFDYFNKLIQNPDQPHYSLLLSLHIVENDMIKFFDQLLGYETTE